MTAFCIEKLTTKITIPPYKTTYGKKNLEKWASDWGLRFNAKKWYILSMKKKSHHSYTLNNQILEQVPSNPYLGLQIAEDLKWKEHINNTC
jgi:hypothetical protein